MSGSASTTTYVSAAANEIATAASPRRTLRGRSPPRRSSTGAVGGSMVTAVSEAVAYGVGDVAAVGVERPLEGRIAQHVLVVDPEVTVNDLPSRPTG